MCDEDQYQLWRQNAASGRLYAFESQVKPATLDPRFSVEADMSCEHNSPETHKPPTINPGDEEATTREPDSAPLSPEDQAAGSLLFAPENPLDRYNGDPSAESGLSESQAVSQSQPDPRSESVSEELNELKKNLNEIFG